MNTLVADSRPCPNCRRPYNKGSYRIVKIDEEAYLFGEVMKERDEEKPKAEEKNREESRKSIGTEVYPRKGIEP